MTPLRVIRGRTLTLQDAQAVQQLVAEQANAGRWALARALCQQWQWRGSTGQLKTRSAMATLHRLNPEVRITPIGERLDEAGLEIAMNQANVVLDCSDNLATRFAVNRACFRQGKPLVSGAAIRFEGQLAVFWPGVGDSACYNCLYPHDEGGVETCSQNGVAAPVPGIIGSLQALEAIKLLTLPAYAPFNVLHLFDGLGFEWQRMRVTRNPDCATCGRNG